MTAISNLRHGLRTPLNVILGYSEMLLEDLELANEQTNYHELQQIRECTIALMSLIKTLLSNETLKFYELDLPRLLTEQSVQDQMQVPTNSIINYCQQILATASDQTLISDVKKINRASQELLTMINDMIGVSNE
ncbi:MAG: histidine kinase dimerization/phospho-acceptor domain-containing protein [Cyanobacteria bacterium P01_F01_bin.143]